MPGHVEALAALVAELNRLYGATKLEPLDRRLQRINNALFSDSPSACALLAWNGDRALGFASYSFLWPAVSLTRSVLLKDLIRALAEIAIKQNFSRLEWQTDRPNTAAQHFYTELGVPVEDSKLFYRVQGEALRELADLFGAVGRRLGERVREASTWSRRFDIIENFLLLRPDAGPRPSPQVV